jgi:hypothetical protein
VDILVERCQRTKQRRLPQRYLDRLDERNLEQQPSLDQLDILHWYDHCHKVIPNHADFHNNEQ